MYVSPFLKMTLEEQIGEGESQSEEPPPDNEEYQEGEGMPVVDEAVQVGNPLVVEATVEPDIVEHTDSDTEKVEPTETDPLQGGACGNGDPSTSKSIDNQSKDASIMEIGEGEENSEKRRTFDIKCAVLGVLLILVIVLGAIGAVLVNSFSAAKVSYTFRFSNYFNDHMVLQRAPQKATVHGTCSGERGKNTTVVLTVETQDGATVKQYSSAVENTGSEDEWVILLDPIEEPGPFIILAKLKGQNTQNIELKDVLFGDVWVCAGQRNMQFSVDMLSEEDKEEEMEDLDQYSEIRLLSLYPDESFVPAAEINRPQLPWSLPSKGSLLGRTIPAHQYASHFSALCWMYGKSLYKARGYPIGLVVSTYYSSAIEDWVPVNVVKTCSINVAHETSRMFNKMIRPLLSTSIFGLIWYQGENDAEMQSTSFYACSLVNMLNSYRTMWYNGTQGGTDPQFPVGIVQLGPYRDGNNETQGYPDIRWQQTANYGYVPNQDLQNSFYAVTLDLPDPEHYVMPRHKRTIADRLIRGALAVAYGDNGEPTHPLFSKYSAHMNNHSLVLVFDSPGEIELQGRDGFEVCCAKDAGAICPMSLITARIAPNREWVPAVVERQNGAYSVTLTFENNEACSEDMHITAVRYLWQESPCEYLACPLYDADSGVPVAPYIKQGLVDDGQYHDFGRDATNKTLV